MYIKWLWLLHVHNNRQASPINLNPPSHRADHCTSSLNFPLSFGLALVAVVFRALSWHLCFLENTTIIQKGGAEWLGLKIYRSTFLCAEQRSDHPEVFLYWRQLVSFGYAASRALFDPPLKENDCS